MYNYPKYLNYEIIEELRRINKDSYKKQLI